MADTDQIERNTTTTTTTSSGGNAGLAFLVGVLFVVVAGLVYVMLGGDAPSGGDDVSITIEGAGSALEGAANAVKNATTGAGN